FYWSNGRLAEAEAAFKAALAAEPANPLALRATALFYVTTGRPLEAEPILKRRAEVVQGPGSKAELASYYLSIGRRGDAARILAEPTALPPASAPRGDPPPPGWRPREQPPADPSRVDAILVRAQALAMDAKWDPALAAVGQALAVDDQSEAAYYVQGRIHASRGSFDEAAAAFERAIAINPRAGAGT